MRVTLIVFHVHRPSRVGWQAGRQASFSLTRPRTCPSIIRIPLEQTFSLYFLPGFIFFSHVHSLAGRREGRSLACAHERALARFCYCCPLISLPHPPSCCRVSFFFFFFFFVFLRLSFRVEPSAAAMLGGLTGRSVMFREHTIDVFL